MKACFESQTPVEICNKLLVKLGLKAEAIARPGTVGKRDRIYQVSGVADPFRARLLEAARRRLAEASPDFDESSVVDGLEMLRDAEGDEAALESIWQALKELPEADRERFRGGDRHSQVLMSERSRFTEVGDRRWEMHCPEARLSHCKIMTQFGFSRLNCA